MRPPTSATAYFTGDEQPIRNIRLKTAVRAMENNGWKRVKGKTAAVRYQHAGQSRLVLRFQQSRGRRIASLVFAMGEPRLDRAVAS